MPSKPIEPKVSEKDKRLFRLIGEALNEPPIKVTKEEKLANFDLGGYFNFLTGSTQFLLATKKKLTKTHDDVPEKIHALALKLGMIRTKTP